MPYDIPEQQHTNHQIAIEIADIGERILYLAMLIDNGYLLAGDNAINGVANLREISEELIDTENDARTLIGDIRFLIERSL